MQAEAAAATRKVGTVVMIEGLPASTGLSGCLGTIVSVPPLASRAGHGNGDGDDDGAGDGYDNDDRHDDRGSGGSGTPGDFEVSLAGTGRVVAVDLSYLRGVDLEPKWHAFGDDQSRAETPAAGTMVGGSLACFSRLSKVTWFTL